MVMIINNDDEDERVLRAQYESIRRTTHMEWLANGCWNGRAAGTTRRTGELECRRRRHTALPTLCVCIDVCVYVCVCVSV